MRVYLGGCKTGVSKQLLDGIQISTTVQQVGCITVSQNMRASFFKGSYQTEIFPDDPVK